MCASAGFARNCTKRLVSGNEVMRSSALSSESSHSLSAMMAEARETLSCKLSALADVLKSQCSSIYYMSSPCRDYF